MTLVRVAHSLADFQASLAQCEGLIANAHQTSSNGAPLLTLLDQKQITAAALLNVFVAWETFLEEVLMALMLGESTLSGIAPVKYVAPLHIDAARSMVIGVQRKYFDYGNHDHVRRLVGLFFQNGYPFEPSLGSIHGELADLRTLRNASAHITSNTQTALEALALRIFGAPRPGVDLYSLLMSVDPRSSSAETVFLAYKNKVLVAAELIANG